MDRRGVRAAVPAGAPGMNPDGLNASGRRRWRARRVRRSVSGRRSRPERRARRSRGQSRRRVRVSRLHSVEGAAARRRSSLDESRHATAWGVEFASHEVDLAKLREFKNAVVKRLTNGTGQLAKLRKVQVHPGHRRASSTRTPCASGEPTAARRRIRFEHAILATGSTPAMPPSR